MQKVDIFLHSNQPLAQSQMQRRQQLALTQKGDRRAWLASPEDIIIQKLLWYRLGNQISDRQWRDILGVLKVRATSLDFEYLQTWTTQLQLEKLMLQALQQAGVDSSGEI